MKHKAKVEADGIKALVNNVYRQLRKKGVCKQCISEIMAHPLKGVCSCALDKSKREKLSALSEAVPCHIPAYYAHYVEKMCGRPWHRLPKELICRISAVERLSEIVIGTPGSAVAAVVAAFVVVIEQYTREFPEHIKAYRLQLPYTVDHCKKAKAHGL